MVPVKPLRGAVPGRVPCFSAWRREHRSGVGRGRSGPRCVFSSRRAFCREESERSLGLIREQKAQTSAVPVRIVRPHDPTSCAYLPVGRGPAGRRGSRGGRSHRRLAKTDRRGGRRIGEFRRAGGGDSAQSCESEGGAADTGCSPADPCRIRPRSRITSAPDPVIPRSPNSPPSPDRGGGSRSASSRPRTRPAWTSTRCAPTGPATPTPPCRCSPSPG